MAIDYQSSFNSGELSGRMNGRNNLEVYNNGCSRLENFFVLPQGGVERRTGTEFISTTENDTSARLIPFSFSSTQSYVAEIGGGYIKMWDSDGSSYSVTGTVPYVLADIAGIEYVQRFDVLYMSHPDYPIQLLKRTSITPTFTIEEIQFDYPPLTTPDDESIAITPSATTGDITIAASDDLFTVDWVGSYIGINQPRGVGESKSGVFNQVGTGYSSELDVIGSYWGASTGGLGNSILQAYDGTSWSDIYSPGYGAWSYASSVKGIAGGVEKIRIYFLEVSGNYSWSLNTDAATSASGNIVDGEVGETLNVSYSKWSIKTTGTWQGRLVAQRSTDGGILWEDYLVLTDTTDLGTPENTTYSSPSYEGKDTYVRLKYIGTGTVEYNISSDDPLQTGLVRVTGYNSATSIDATVESTLAEASETISWMQSAFSNIRGWPRAIAFHEDRLWIAGSGVDPAVIYASVSGDYANFLTGSTADMSIYRIPDNPELAQWLIGRNELIMGTEGGAIAVRSVDSSALIDASNIVTESQAVFGASDITAIEANDVVIYPERSKKKLRELVYNSDEENYRSADMNILNNDILSETVSELFLQQQPDQIIWTVLGDGTMAHLTYERVQEVVGWGRFITNGEVESACRLPTATSEDDIWMCVKRGAKYCIEKTRPRGDADWYVDSGSTDKDALSHLEGLEVRCMVDGVNDGLYTVSGGSITPTAGTDYLIGLDYDSILRTMPIEPTLANKLSNSRVKGAVKAIAEFETTTGGSIREKNKTGELLDEVEFSGEKRFNIASDWTREKIIEIKQHLPYPMTILSLAVWTEVKGG